MLIFSLFIHLQLLIIGTLPFLRHSIGFLIMLKYLSLRTLYYIMHIFSYRTIEIEVQNADISSSGVTERENGPKTAHQINKSLFQAFIKILQTFTLYHFRFNADFTT